MTYGDMENIESQYHLSHKDALVRLKRASGHLNKVNCIEILQQ